MNIALCDDNLNDIAAMVNILEGYQSSYFSEVEYSVFHNGFELLSALERGDHFDLCCLDVIMPNFNGIELGKEIRNYDKNIQIIFFTSSPDFALESYSVKAANYILKPVTPESFITALNDILEHIKNDTQESILLKSQEGIQKIFLSNLLYVEALGKNTIYYTRCGRTIVCKKKFSDVCEELLEYESFIKTHRSYLVNMNFIDCITAKEIRLEPFALIPIAKGKAKIIKEQYLIFQMGG